jgi:hypothetical protein
MTSNDQEIANNVVREDVDGESTDNTSTSARSGNQSASSFVTHGNMKDLVCRLPGKLLPNGRKTRGRVKISMEFIKNRLKRQATFSKRKSGIMKKVTMNKNSIKRIMQAS